METKEQPKIPEGLYEKIRVSISNLVRECRVKETGETHFIAIKGKPLKKDGKEYPRFQALGGAVKLTPKGKEYFIEKFNAQFGIQGRPEEENNDARFILELPKEMQEFSAYTEEQKNEAAERRNQYMEKVLSFFFGKDNPLFEEDVRRETLEDLSNVILEGENNKISTKYESTVSPIQWKIKTSERETGIPSFRLFRLFTLEVPQDIFNKMQKSDTIRILSEEDIMATHKATEVGDPVAITSDGIAIVENIFPDVRDKN
ncbi:MAG TPA: hypothetical protein PLF70_02460 [Candidatus Portnoybacteria bacterium]|nr:hypothetical protein [Candidatus Portnoybacteria bacterium]